jgi:hypothetical protein
MKRSWWFFILLIAGLGASLTLAQRMRSGGFGPGGPRMSPRQSPDRGYSQRPDRQGLPDWQVDTEFQHDVFTFVRIRYSTGYGGRGFGRGGFGRGGYGRGMGGTWAIDYPDADLNISYRLHQLTSLEVNPDGLVLELTDPELFNYPFIHINPGDPVGVVFTDDEVKCLRKYLLNGGFLFVTDFWGDEEWNDFHAQMQRVFPEREPIELPLDHPIFHCVFDLKEKPQVSAIESAVRGRAQGITWEHWEQPDTKEVHYRAYLDDKGRVMALMVHNCDLTDGWEREGDNEWYFHEFAEKRAYPIGVNIVFYAMTH